MRFLSVCSGIEAASVAWTPLGWSAAAFSEIEKFPSSVLDHHYPTVPNLGDMTKFKEWPDAIIDVLVGGTPCQSFSIAGLRKGLDDPRGNLMLTYLAIAARYRPKWLVWENVPGVLSSNGGKDFGTLLGGLGQLGYGFAYRILDAQYLGVPQRRRRVFVVGYIGNWRRAAAVLFERHSLSGNTAPSREKGQDVAGTFKACAGSYGWSNSADHAAAGYMVPIASTGDTSHCLNAGGMGRQDYETETLITHSLRGEGFDASEDGTGRGTPLVPVAYRTAGDGAVYEEGDRTAPLTTGTDPSSNVVAFDLAQITSKENRSRAESGLPTGTLSKNSDMHVAASMQVRRLTPRECERLQGFSDDYTLIPLHQKNPVDALKFSCDGPRYKALGNSMAVPVMRWIGERIAMVSRIEA